MTNQTHIRTTASRRTAAILAFAAAALAVLATTVAWAYKVSPLLIYLEPTGPQAKSFVTIDNTHDFPVTLELYATERAIGPDGAETSSPADDDFLIFPPQLILAPGERQRVQLAYVAGPTDTSKAYRLVVDQVVVEGGNEEGMDLDFRYVFRAGVYVVPPSAKFNVSVTSIEPVDGGYRVSLRNDGNAHAVLTSGPWAATDSAGNTATLAMGDTALKEAPLIAPNSERTALVPSAALGTLADLASVTVTPER